MAMSRRANPPRNVRHDDNTVRETSRSEPETERPLKFIVALDFGTTNTSVSYVKFDPEKGPGSVHSTNIKSIRAWPDAASGQNDSDHNANVPSESWYLDGEYIWGYSVQQRMGEQLAQDFKPSQDVIKFSKLLLNHERQSLQPLRTQLERINKSVHEVIRDYLTQIFTHTKKELIEEENFSDICAVELVLCLPAGWSFAAQRDIQRIMEDVTKEVDFGWRDFEPFILNEPEAVAAYLLESMDPSDALKGKDIAPKKGQTFIVCDAGGGTVDTTTYRVTHVNPYRFQEVTRPAGRDCGSSRINEKMFQEAAERLKDNPFLEMSHVSKEYLIQQYILGAFETKIKRQFTYEQYQGLKNTRIPLAIVGLRRDDAKDIGENSFYITSERMALYFKESIEGTVELLKQQKKEAARKGEDVVKIILAGGFSSSNALQKRVQEEFPGVGVLTPKKLDVSTIVSHGAVFRALNKENGPERIILASFGLLQDERYNDKFEGHVLRNITQGTLDPDEGWAVEVIEWLIKMNKKLGKQVSYRSTLCQLFEIGDDWIVRQRIYSSPNSVKDHYHIRHKFNAMAEVAGVVEANLNEYRDDGSIQPKVAKNHKKYFSLEYEIVLEVDGRNIKAKLFYPPGQECRDELKICISACFRAGTE